MPQNAQNPAGQNPSKTGISFWEYEPTWKVFNHIQFIVRNLPLCTYEQVVQNKLQDIQSCCQDMVNEDGPAFLPGQGQLSPSDAAKLIAPLAEQLKASVAKGIPDLAEFIASRCKDMESLSTS
jgi:hypothetical protein